MAWRAARGRALEKWGCHFSGARPRKRKSIYGARLGDGRSTPNTGACKWGARATPLAHYQTRPWFAAITIFKGLNVSLLFIYLKTYRYNSAFTGAMPRRRPTSIGPICRAMSSHITKNTPLRLSLCKSPKRGPIIPFICRQNLLPDTIKIKMWLLPQATKKTYLCR